MDISTSTRAARLNPILRPMRTFGLPPRFMMDATPVLWSRFVPIRSLLDSREDRASGRPQLAVGRLLDARFGRHPRRA